MHRRRALALLGSGAAAGVAGCFGVLGGDEDDGTSTEVSVGDVSADTIDGGLSLRVTEVAPFTGSSPASVRLALRNEGRSELFVGGIGAGRPFQSMTFEYEEGATGLYGLSGRLEELVPERPEGDVCWRATAAPENSLPPGSTSIGAGMEVPGTYTLTAPPAGGNADGGDCLAAGRYRTEEELEVGPDPEEVEAVTIGLSLTLER